MINAYDNAILHLDHTIGIVMKTLESKNLSDNTIIILLSDYAEAFGEHSTFFHTTIMHNEAIHVPLLILLPEKIQRQIDDTKLENLKIYQNEYISNVDIMPTILDFYGVLDHQKTDGISLLNDTEENLFFQLPMLMILHLHILIH